MMTRSSQNVQISNLNDLITTQQTLLTPYKTIASFDNDIALYKLKSEYNSEMANYTPTSVLNSTLSLYKTKAEFNSDIALYKKISDFDTDTADFVSIDMMNDTLINYKTVASFNADIANYATNSNLNSQLANYKTISSFNADISNYVQTNIFTTAIAPLVSNTQLTNTLANYVDNTTFTNTTNNLKTIASFNTDILNYPTIAEQTTAISNALVPYSTTTQVNSSISTALIPYSTTTQMNSAITTAVDDSKIGSLGIAIASGRIGEVLTANASNVAVVNNTTLNICQLTLPAGNWYLEASFYVVHSVAGGVTNVNHVSISNTSLNPNANLYDRFSQVAGLACTSQSGQIPATYMLLTTSTTLYLVANFTRSTVGTCTCSGRINAYRLS